MAPLVVSTVDLTIILPVFRSLQVSPYSDSPLKTVVMVTTGTIGARSAVLASQAAKNAPDAASAKSVKIQRWSTQEVNVFAKRVSFKQMALVHQVVLKANTGMKDPNGAKTAGETAQVVNREEPAALVATDSNFTRTSGADATVVSIPMMAPASPKTSSAMKTSSNATISVTTAKTSVLHVKMT